jgi:copper chaperone NosL
MAVSEPRFAAQLVAPGEEPLFFDDIGCLRGALAARAPLPGAVAFVADHRTAAWVRADGATYVLQPDVETPMGSHLLAHADAGSREGDPAARGGRVLSPGEVFGEGGQGQKGGAR